MPIRTGAEVSRDGNFMQVVLAIPLDDLRTGDSYSMGQNAQRAVRSVVDDYVARCRAAGVRPDMAALDLDECEGEDDGGFIPDPPPPTCSSPSPNGALPCSRNIGHRGSHQAFEYNDTCETLLEEWRTGAVAEAADQPRLRFRDESGDASAAPAQYGSDQLSGDAAARGTRTGSGSFPTFLDAPLGGMCANRSEGYTCSLRTHHTGAHRAYMDHHILAANEVYSWGNRNEFDLRAFAEGMRRCSATSTSMFTCSRATGHPGAHEAWESHSLGGRVHANVVDIWTVSLGEMPPYAERPSESPYQLSRLDEFSERMRRQGEGNLIGRGAMDGSSDEIRRREHDYPRVDSCRCDECMHNPRLECETERRTAAGYLYHIRDYQDAWLNQAWDSQMHPDNGRTMSAEDWQIVADERNRRQLLAPALCHCLECERNGLR